ncbi:beta-ketoacyl synthase N-terminal-like domain-containing protein [Streptomyces sp. NPDC048106]|uniref:type I polyketide synthase n=1 Tax=Streptomyces sp. NPDC048106 TaxID=3155750 RepID=UPI003451C6B0
MTREEQIVEALRRSVKDNQRLRQEIQTLRDRTREPVAVVSMACRLPGGVRSPEDMWEVLVRGEETLSEFPDDRGWDLDALYDPTPGLPGRCYTRVGGFLDGAGDFDPAFFGITPREAMAMDPQQRLLMRTAWEAVERAGLPSERLRETATGVFVGALSPKYSPGTNRVPEQYAGYVMTGNETSVLSGRIAYHLGLNGPAVTIDTACSSSLVALHLAAQSLRSGECDLALAGGVTVMSTPDTLVEFSIQRGLAPDGHCKPFSAAADGTVLGEGAGVLLLARLADARRLGLPVLAVVKGSALNQDGASNGLTAPSGTAQRALIRSALDNAGLAPGDVDLVEAHGTGTALGDPIEAQALLDVYGRDRPADSPLHLGSLKSNFGHPQAAAGVAGVIKTVLALRAGRMPRTLHLDRPSPHVDWESAHVRLLDEDRDWPAGDRPRRAAVSSFGISGTNAHVVLEEAPADTPPGAAPEPTGTPGTAPDPAHRVFLLSGHGRAALRAQAARLAAHLAAHPEAAPAAVAGALATTRTAFGHRAAVVARTTDEVSEALRALADGLPHSRLVTDEVRRGRTAFLFAGQGAHRAGMGAELHAAQPAFADALDEITEAFDRHQPRPLREVMFGTGPQTAGLLERTVHAQPALFAFEVAMCRLLASWGLRPDVLLGHSIGELAAAHVAGVWSLEDAAALVSARGRLMDALPAGGAMAALQASESEVLAELERTGSAACVAAVNGPQAVVVSGPEADVLAAVAHWKAAGRKATRLRVSHAFHSDLVTPVLEEFREVAESLTYRRPAVPVVSDVTGTLAPPEQLCSPGYWVRHVREAVRFADGVRTLRDQAVATLLDVGPNGSLAALASGCLAGPAPDAASAAWDADDGVATIAASRQTGTEAETVLLAVGAAHARGAAVDRAALTGPVSAPADLPTYAFQDTRYWWSLPSGGAARAGEPSADAPAEPSADAVTDVREVLGGERLAAVVRAEVAAVTGLPSPADVDPQRSFLDIGLTSVGALELHRRLQAATGARISVTFAYEHPTPAALCAHLEAATATRTPPPQVVPAPAAPTADAGPAAPVDTDSSAPAADAGPVDDDAIAIVAMACRYPGGVTGPEELWELVRDETDAVSGFPEDRGWPLADLYHPDPEHSGTSYTREGGFLDDVAGFDAPFFGVSAREAAAMDPQHRLLLETAWEALERAGVDPLSVRESALGVFLGIAMQDYRPHAADGEAEDADQMAAYRITGLAPSVASGRIAYLLGARGPAMTVDTACSSSLVALHLAVQSLRTGESDMALAGGATVLATPDSFIGFSRQRGLSPDGRCKAFSADADGTGWAEGAGMLLLETVGRARRLGHPVLAVVRGTALNQDGASNGLTAPNGLAQQDVIRKALSNAGLAPQDVDLVEAHGTGTALGDPVEVNALLATYGAKRDAERPLRLGSLKSNIGHSMAAAGVGGIIKTVMALRHERMPRTLHADRPTPHADWDFGSVRLLTEAIAWPRRDTPRRAAVSAFGMSGTNAHAVLEEAPREPAPVSAAAPHGGPLVWLLSAPTRSALRAQARLHAEHARNHPEQDARAIGRVLAGRSLFRHRAVVSGTDRAALLDGLDALAAGRTSPGLVEGAAGSRRTVLVEPPGTDDGWADAWRSYGVEPHLVLRSDDPELSARLTAAVADGHDLVLQCAPGLGVLGQVQQVAAAADPKVTVVLCTGRPDPADDRFVRALAQAHVGGAPVDWSRLTGGRGGPLVADVPTYAFQRTRHWAAKAGPAPAAGVPGTARAAGPVPDCAGWDAEVQGEERGEALLALVCGAVADLLGIDEADLDPEDGFFQQGLDSLMAVRLRQRLEREFGKTLPTTLLFERPTAAALAAFLAEEVAVTAPTDGPATADGPPMEDDAERLPLAKADGEEGAGAVGAGTDDDEENDLLALLEAEIDRATTVREGMTRR